MVLPIPFTPLQEEGGPRPMSCDGIQLQGSWFLHRRNFVLLGKNAELISKLYLVICISSISPCVHLLFKLKGELTTLVSLGMKSLWFPLLLSCFFSILCSKLGSDYRALYSQPYFLIFSLSTFQKFWGKKKKKVSGISNYMKARIMHRLLYSGVIYLAWRS